MGKPWREKDVFLIQVDPKTSESCNQVGHQMFSRVDSCKQHVRNVVIFLQSDPPLRQPGECATPRQQMSDCPTSLSFK